jgi:glycosyltransferase involved in cell wall biosynthesis
LYSAADSFVFPSFYEGFGIPLLEARANNTQVICTDIPELRESGGKNAIFIQPDVAGIRAGILEAYAHQDRNEQAMLDDSDLPTWQDEARKLAELIAVREVN